MNKNKNYSMWFYIITCIISLFAMRFVYCNYAKERKIFIQEAVNDFEKNTLLTISNFSLIHSQTNFNLENNIKEHLDEVVKPHFDLLKSILKDSSDFGINTVSFWLAFLSIIMIIFTILGIFVNNNILETNRKEAELNIQDFKIKSSDEFKNLESNLLNKSKEVICKIKNDMEISKKEIFDNVNNIKNIKKEAYILKNEILKIKMEAENILNKIKEETKQSVQSTNDAKVKKLFRKALKESRKGNINESIKYYTELLKLDKNNFEALNNRGNLYNEKYSNIEEKEYFDLALNNYNKALNIYKNNLDALSNRGILYRKKYTYTKNEEYFDLALNDYNIVLNIKNDDLYVLIGIGWLYLVDYIICKNIESLSNAEKYIEKGLTIDNSNLHLLNNKGIMLLFKYRIEKDIKILEGAEKYLNRAISNKVEKHNLGETYYYLSLLYKEYLQLETTDNIKKEEYKKKSEEALKKSKELGYENFIED